MGAGGRGVKLEKASWRSHMGVKHSVMEESHQDLALPRVATQPFSSNAISQGLSLFRHNMGGLHHVTRKITPHSTSPQCGEIKSERHFFFLLW